MEEYLEKLIQDNTSQFEELLNIIRDNSQNIDRLKGEFGNVEKQHFEMNNINEALEQRIE
jgi:hypothetical protein